MCEIKLNKILLILGNFSKQRFRETFFIKNYESLTKEILEYTKNLYLEKFPQKVWHWVNDIPNDFLCTTCNKNTTTFNKNWLDGYRPYCSAKCSSTNKTTTEKRKNTCIDIYGVDNVAKNKDIKKKTIETNLKVYGYKSTFQNEQVREKWKIVIKERYGVEHIFQSDVFKKKINQNKKEIIKERYGVEHIFQSDVFKNKSKETTKNRIFKKYQDCFITEYIFVDYKDSFFNIIHKTCNKEFEISLHSLIDRKNANNCICTECYPIGENSSIPEKEIVNWIESLGIKTIKDREVLEGQELDILIPSHNIAIEHNGLYHHSDKFKKPNYHLNKTNKCLEKGIDLIHIWGDEWKYKKDIIKSILLYKLGLIKEKIYSRKTIIKEIKDSKLVRKFLDENHIQGFAPSSTKIGLYYNEELVSLMCFGYANSNNKKELELIRFCNKINYNIIGSASKLFNHYITNYKFDKIISYSYKRLFNGEIYKKLGFVNIHTTKKPEYFWVKDNERKHRSVFNKKKLIKNGYDPNKTEVEIMNDRGYFRIWGCGQIRWEFSIK